MALTIEDGTVVANADSYTDASDVDTYFTDTDGSIPVAWSNLTTAVQEAYLRQATRFLDSKYRTLWIGTRYDADQSLEWPRTGATTRDGFTLTVSTIPKELIWATSELCRRLLTAASLDPDLTDERKVRSERLRAEPLEIQSVFESVGSSHTIYQRVDLLLGRILRTTTPSGLSVFTLERA